MSDVKRVVSISFWTDEKVVNVFSPEDKLFMLYLLTNPHTTQLGIYKLVPRQAAFELGYSEDTVKVLLDRFETKYGLIKYSKDTCEIAIKNYLRHAIVKGGKPVMDCLIKEEEKVKDKSLLLYIYNNIKDSNNLNITVQEFIQHINNNNDNERIVDESYHESSPQKDIDDFFEKIWQLYPKKLGKSSISKSKKKELYKVGYDALAKCIERYKEETKGWDIKYIKHGSTFFNNGYKDYLDKNYNADSCEEIAEDPFASLQG